MQSMVVLAQLVYILSFAKKLQNFRLIYDVHGCVEGDTLLNESK